MTFINIVQKKKLSNIDFQRLMIIMILVLMIFANNIIAVSLKLKLKSKTSKNSLKTNTKKNKLKSKNNKYYENQYANANIGIRGGNVYVDNATITVDPSPQVRALGPYGMFNDLSKPLRYYKGRLVEEDPYHVSRHWTRVRDKLLGGIKVKSAQPLEIGDFDGNFIRLDRPPPLANRYGYYDPVYHGNDAVL